MRKSRRTGTNRRRRYGPSRIRPQGGARPRTEIAVRGGRDPGRIGKALIVLMWAGISLVPIPFSVPDIRLAAGVVGWCVSCQRTGGRL